LFELVDDIKQKEANLKSMKNNWLDLSENNPYSEFLMTVMGGVNQLERDIIRMRQREGIDLAKKEGKYRGRVQKYHAGHEGMNHAVKLYKEGEMTVQKICDITNVSRSALYRRLHQDGEPHYKIVFSNVAPQSANRFRTPKTSENIFSYSGKTWSSNEMTFRFKLEH